jgi:hypothetical protein
VRTDGRGDDRRGADRPAGGGYGAPDRLDHRADTERTTGDDDVPPPRPAR